MKIIILAAGKGSRLGEHGIPKPLTHLANGKSILAQQIENIAACTSLDNVIIVVGYHKEMIMEDFPDVLFVYNPDYAQENTSKSLLRALRKVNEDVVWINGDVVFHSSVLPKILDFNRTCMLTNLCFVGEEEVKYHADSHGRILEVSKQVENAQGEALGLNLFKAKDLDVLRQELAHCKDNDYFEKAIETGIQKGLHIWSCPIDSSLCTEIDFPEDLNRANQLIKSWDHSI